MKKNIESMTLLGLMSAIVIIMTIIPGIGFIPLGFVNVTIVHIPVIIIGIVKGPKLGAILGIIMGIASLMNALLRPIPTSFLFMNPIISILPRMMIGILSGLSYKFLNQISKNIGNKVKIAISSAIGSLVNSIGVLGLIYIIYAQKYMQAIGKTGESAFKFIFGIFISNGILEMLISIILVTAIASALLKFEQKRIK